jgi:Protein of unknown function (DUF3443)
MLRTFVVAAIFAQAVTPKCGGGSSASSLQNFQAITVNAGPANSGFNNAFTTVTVCIPGQSTCQTIDGVLIDTGSSGVRILASKLTGLALPPQVDASGAPISECTQFVDGFSWGPIATADVRLGGEQASGVPIQLIGGGDSAVPTACANTGTEEDTLDSFGANGVLGVGLFRQDCGFACSVTGPANPAMYYSCPSSGCVVTTETLDRQVQNPVWLFASDNNGVAIQLPSVADAGAAAVGGMIVYGIGTQSNNALGSAKVLTVDGAGNFTTVYAGQSYGSTYIDSGSNGIFFLDSATTGLPLCRVSTDFYCPPTRQSLSATHRGASGATSAFTFTVGSVDVLNASVTAFTGAAGPNAGSFDWGLPFFYGRTVFTAIEGQATPAGTGPYVAY